MTISWNAVTGAQVPGPFSYHLLRDGVAVADCDTAAVSCLDTPPAGHHFCTVYSISGTGVASPASASAEADLR